MTSRYAIFFAPPPGSDLWRFGSDILGYDAATGLDAGTFVDMPVPNWSALTEEPRRYGFHATLKAPFALASGHTESELIEAARLFARQRRGFHVATLKVSALGSFVALVPADPAPDLDALAADCVRNFDLFRAPLSPTDRQRRLASPLNERQIGHLDAWGYPHVFADFRFHMTLSGSLPAADREPVLSALAGHYGGIAPGIAVDAITIFRQADRGARFRILERVPFGA